MRTFTEHIPSIHLKCSNVIEINHSTQEYIIVAALALADALAGAAYMVSGLWRIGIIVAGNRNLKVCQFTNK
jgi:hypothetical protein